MRNAVLASCALLALSVGAPRASAQVDKLNAYGNPPRLTPSPTSAAISAKDLQTRLYQFADDSMQGRQIGRLGNMKGTAYIAAEMKRLGLVPAGDNGTYFQVLPYHLRSFTNHSRLTVNGNPMTLNEEWVPVAGPRAPRPVAPVEVIFGGVAGDTAKQITAAQGAGKFVVLLPAPPPAAPLPGAPGGGGRGFAFGPNRFADAAAVATADLDALTDAQRIAINTPTVATNLGGRGAPPANPNAPVDSIALLKAQLNALAPAAVIRLTKAAAARRWASCAGTRARSSSTPRSGAAPRSRSSFRSPEGSATTKPSRLLSLRRGTTRARCSWLMTRRACAPPWGACFAFTDWKLSRLPTGARQSSCSGAARNASPSCCSTSRCRTWTASRHLPRCTASDPMYRWC